MTDHTQGNWTNLNRNINTLQYYAASGSDDGSLYGGMQDNGSARTFPAPSTSAIRESSTAYERGALETTTPNRSTPRAPAARTARNDWNTSVS